MRQYLQYLRPPKRIIQEIWRYHSPILSSHSLYVHPDRVFSLPHLAQRPARPDFLVIGAQKSGSTFLHHYLSRHPDIFMSSPVKEPGYYMDFEFVRQAMRLRGIRFRSRSQLLRRHMLRGYAGEALIGESSTYYTAIDVAREQRIPARIYAEHSATKFIYILRNPLARLISNYLHDYGRRHKLSLSEAIAADKRYIYTSRYGYQLSQYLAKFGREQFLILLFEDLVANPEATIRRALSFLQLPEMVLPKLEKKNESRNRGRFAEAELRLGESCADVIDTIHRDVDLLSKLTGVDFDAWDLSRDVWCEPRLSEAEEVRPALGKQRYAD